MWRVMLWRVMVWCGDGVVCDVVVWGWCGVSSVVCLV